MEITVRPSVAAVTALSFRMSACHAATLVPTVLLITAPALMLAMIGWEWEARLLALPSLLMVSLIATIQGARKVQRRDGAIASTERASMSWRTLSRAAIVHFLPAVPWAIPIAVAILGQVHTFHAIESARAPTPSDLQPWAGHAGTVTTVSITLALSISIALEVMLFAALPIILVDRGRDYLRRSWQFARERLPYVSTAAILLALLAPAGDIALAFCASPSPATVAISIAWSAVMTSIAAVVHVVVYLQLSRF